MRVFCATFYLVITKIVLILVRDFLNGGTKTLNGQLSAPDYMPLILAGAVMMVLAYNADKIIQAGLNQLRDALFASVGQYAVRQLAYKTFVHMHQLSLRFHLGRRTGGLSPVIERGTKGIDTIVRFTILHPLPPILEFALPAVLFALSYGFSSLLVVAAT